MSAASKACQQLVRSNLAIQVPFLVLFLRIRRKKINNKREGRGKK
jgi:hypothetical protein